MNRIQPSSAFKILLEIMRRIIFGKFIKFSFWRFSAIFGMPNIRIGKSFEDDASRWRQLSSRFSDTLLTCLWSNCSWCHICFEKWKLAQIFNRNPNWNRNSRHYDSFRQYCEWFVNAAFAPCSMNILVLKMDRRWTANSDALYTEIAYVIIFRVIYLNPFSGTIK